MKVFDSGKNFIVISLFLLSACTVSQTGQRAEYDDMYYNSEDRLAEAQLIAERQKNTGYEEEYPDKNTNPDYYAEEQTQASSREVNPYDTYGNRSRMNPNFYPGDYYGYGYSGRFNDPYYQDWQFRNGFYNDPWMAQSFYGMDPFFGGWNSGFSMYYGNAYDPYFGYSYNRWNRVNAYNRGFYNGYWFNRSYGEGNYIVSGDGRDVRTGTGHSSRGRRDLRPNTTNNTAPAQSDQQRSRSSYNPNDNNTSGSSYQRRSRRSNSSGSYQRGTKRSSGSSYQRRSRSSDNSSGSSYQRRSRSSGNSSGRSSRRSGRDD